MSRMGWRLALTLFGATTALILAPRAHADGLAAIPVNRWILQPPPAQILPTGRSGLYEGRGWNHLRYDSLSGSMILYDGYVEPPNYPAGNIYSNSIWRYEAVTNRLVLERLSNWTRKNGATVPLPANKNDPTPFDRHSYSCIVHSASKNRLYLWAGANSSISTSHIGNTWIYDLATRAWREVAEPSPYTVFEQSCSYDPSLETIVLFGGAATDYGNGGKTYLFDVNTERWTDPAPSPSPSPRFGQTMCFDPVRRVTWMFGGGPYGQATSELWSYDVRSNLWTQIEAAAGWPAARRFTHMAYDSNHDVILLWGGLTAQDTSLNDTWIFDPAARTWWPLTPESSPSGSLRWYSEDMDYDPVNNVFVLNLGGAFWLYRYAELAPPLPPPPSDLVASAPTCGQTHLTWVDAASDETGYEVERSTSGAAGPFTLLASPPAGATSYDDRNLGAGSEYCYRVRAMRESDASEYAGPACVTTPVPLPGAIDFDGQSYVAFGDAPALALEQFTVECWLRRDGPGTSLSTGAAGVPDAIPVVGRGTFREDGTASALNFFVGLRASDGVLCADFIDDGSDSAGATNHPVAGILPVGTGWHHVAATYDGSLWVLYFDGWPERALTVGRRPGAGARQTLAAGAGLDTTEAPRGFFDGAIDELRIWNHALSMSEIQAMADSAITSPRPGLIGRWSFDEGTGAFVNGSAGSAIGGWVISAQPIWSTSAPFDLDFARPEAPTDLVATAAGPTRIELHWSDHASNETDFQIERSSGGPDGAFTIIGTSSANDTSYSDQDLSPSTEYCYRVAALNRNGVSSNAGPSCATTLAASGFVLATFVDPAEAGSVGRDPEAPEYEPGTSVSLTANAASEWEFRSWCGDASGLDNPITVEMTQAREVLAIFSEIGSPHVTVLTPNPGDQLTIGAPLEVRWSTVEEEGADRIDILLSHSGWMGPFDTLATAVENTAVWTGIVTGPTTTNAYMKVIARTPTEPGPERTGWDLVDSAFTIADFTTTGIEVDPNPRFALRIASSNPTRDGIGLELDMPRAAPVRVDVWDVSGRLVANLAAAQWSAGRHVLRWPAANAGSMPASGIYFVRFVTPGYKATRKIVLLR